MARHTDLTRIEPILHYYVDCATANGIDEDDVDEFVDDIGTATEDAFEEYGIEYSNEDIMAMQLLTLEKLLNAIMVPDESVDDHFDRVSSDIEENPRPTLTFLTGSATTRMGCPDGLRALGSVAHEEDGL